MDTYTTLLKDKQLQRKRINRKYFGCFEYLSKKTQSTFFDVLIVVAQSYMSLQRVQTQTGFHISGICSKTTIIAFTLFDLPNKPLR